MAYPPPVLSPGDVIECKLSGTLDGQVWINTFHYIMAEGSDLVGIDTIGDAFKIAVWDTGAFAALKSVLSEDVELNNITTQRLYPTRTVAWPLDFTPENGEIAGPACPTSVAVVLRRKGLLGNRHNYGRIFVCGLPAVDAAFSKIAVARRPDWLEVSALMARSLEIVSGGDTATADPVLIRRLNPSVYLPVATSGIDYILRVQRRREVGRGI